MKVRRALISVSDKSGLKEFVRGLKALGVEIISTGGTAQFIRDAGVEVTDVSAVTGFPEILDGRVKTLHPKIHGALLALRGDKGHMDKLREHGIGLIDMVVVNLYPFAETVARKDVTSEEAIEKIDIGGPSMLRSAAKNYRDVAVVPDPSFYPAVLEELNRNGSSLKPDTLLGLAGAAFEKTASYDRMIADYLGKGAGDSGVFPDRLKISVRKTSDLRYGENPHQKAALYRIEGASGAGVSSWRRLHGKELSFNNILDLDAAFSVVREFDGPAAAIIKHTNPCGAACAPSLRSAFRDAFACDPLSAFGGIIGLNRAVDRETAEEISGAGFMECIIAPSFGEDALSILARKKNIRLIETGGCADGLSGPAPSGFDIKKVSGGMLIQEPDTAAVTENGLKVVTKKRPAADEIAALLFGWKVVKHVRSNAIVLSRGMKTVGIGAGQMSRVDSVMIAIRKAGDRSRGSVLASDAFFPKPDSVSEAARAGVTSIIQPGGSVADDEIVKEADSAGLSMVFTGIRHFKH